MPLSAACGAFLGDAARVFGRSFDANLETEGLKGVVGRETLSIGCCAALWVVLWSVGAEG